MEDIGLKVSAKVFPALFDNFCFDASLTFYNRLGSFFFQNYLSKTLGISSPKLSSHSWLLHHPKFRVTVQSSVNYELNITVFSSNSCERLFTS